MVFLRWCYHWTTAQLSITLNYRLWECWELLCTLSCRWVCSLLLMLQRQLSTLKHLKPTYLLKKKKKITILTSLPCFASSSFPAPLPIGLEAVKCCCHPLSKQEEPAVPPSLCQWGRTAPSWDTKQSSAFRGSWQSCEKRTGRTQLWQTWQELLKSQQKNNSMATRLWKLNFLPTNCQ